MRSCACEILKEGFVALLESKRSFAEQLLKGGILLSFGLLDLERVFAIRFALIPKFLDVTFYVSCRPLSQTRQSLLFPL